MLIIPLQATPSQSVNALLANQACIIDVYQKAYGLFMDIFVNNNTTPLLAGVRCENLNRIVRSAYLGFVGDFTFIDTQGFSDPVSTGLGSQYVLAYLEETDLP